MLTILFVCLSAGRVGLTLRRNKEPCLAWQHQCLLPSSEWGWPRVGSCQSQPSLDINHCYLSSGEAGPASRAPPNIGWAPGGWGGCPWPRPRPPEPLTSSHKSISVSSMSSQRPLHSHINSQKKYHKNMPLQKGYSIFWPVACCFLRPLAWLFYISLGSVTHNYLRAQAQPQASTCQICAISKSIIIMTFNFPVLKPHCAGRLSVTIAPHSLSAVSSCSLPSGVIVLFLTNNHNWIILSLWCYISQIMEDNPVGMYQHILHKSQSYNECQAWHY